MKDEHEEDIVFEEDEAAAENVGADFQNKLKKVKDRLKKCEAEKQEYLDGWQRSQAEFANLRKQDEKERVEILKYAEQGILEELLAVVDSFDMAFSNKEAWESAPENWRMGIEHIYNQLSGILDNHGLTKINAEGQEFNPETHEAVENVPVDDKKQDHKVISVLQTGYTLNGKLIRPAKVKVGVLEA